MDLLRAPWVLATVVVSALWYWRGSRRPSLRAVGTRSRPRGVPWRGLCFAAGLLAVLVALDSPVERLADDWFWAHMLQHVLLMMVAAPLLSSCNHRTHTLWVGGIGLGFSNMLL